MKRSAWLLSAVLFASLASAQQKPISQTYKQEILEAKTIAVVADPNSSAQDSQENQRARLAVAKALRDWGKYEVVSDAAHSDLIMVVRVGHSHAATANGTTTPPPVLVDPSSSGANIGLHRGQNPPLSRTETSSDWPQARAGYEVGSDADLLDLYLGKMPFAGDGRNPSEYPLDDPPAWSYSGKDALQSPKLEAVTQFEKAVAAAEKKKP